MDQNQVREIVEILLFAYRTPASFLARRHKQAVTGCERSAIQPAAGLQLRTGIRVLTDSCQLSVQFLPDTEGKIASNGTASSRRG